MAVAVAAKAHRKPARKRDALAVKVIDVRCAVLRLTHGNGLPRRCRKRDKPLIGRGVGP